MPSRPVVDFLDREKVPYEVLPHMRTYTAQGAAASLHVRGREFAKSVILKTDDGRLAMAVVPAPRPVDLQAAAAAMGAKVELAREEEFADLFMDCEVGAEPPFGNLYGVPVFVDESLRKDPEIVFNAGRHDEAMRMRYADFERLVHPAVASLSSAS
jgi:Ala-tRNA(Pro) deacylase